MNNKELVKETSALLRKAAENISAFIEKKDNKDITEATNKILWNVIRRSMVEEYSGEADAIDFLEMLSVAFKDFTEVE